MRRPETSITTSDASACLSLSTAADATAPPRVPTSADKATSPGSPAATCQRYLTPAPWRRKRPGSGITSGHGIGKGSREDRSRAGLGQDARAESRRDSCPCRRAVLSFLVGCRPFVLEPPLWP